MSNDLKEMKNMAVLLKENLAKLSASAKDIKGLEGMNPTKLSGIIANVTEEAEALNRYIETIK